MYWFHCPSRWSTPLRLQRLRIRHGLQHGLDPLRRGSAALIAGLALLVCASCGRSPTKPLVLIGEAGGACQSSANAAHWAELQRNPTEIGLDYLTVNSDEPVVIEAVSLIGGAGGLRVVEASIAPGGGVGVFTYKGTETHLPAGFRSRLSVPGATLTKNHATPAELRANPSANAYQIVVGVVPTRAFSSARAVRLTYRAGERSGMLVGRDFIIVSLRTTACSTSGLVPAGQ